jgi:hypothetical protein
MSSNPPARIPTPDPQCSCDLHEPPLAVDPPRTRTARDLPLPPPPSWREAPDVPTVRYRRLPEIPPEADEEPTEPGTPPPPLAASIAKATPPWQPGAGLL